MATKPFFSKIILSGIGLVFAGFLSGVGNDAWNLIKSWISGTSQAPSASIVQIGTYILVGVGIAAIILGILKKKYPHLLLSKQQPQNEKSISDYELKGKINHSKDLNRVYRRLSCVKAVNNEKNELVFKVPDSKINPDSLKHLPKEEKDRIMSEHFSAPWTDIRYIPDLGIALIHLKYYKSIDKHWKKSDHLLKKFYDKKEEKIKTELNASLKKFNYELSLLVDKIDKYNHILQGKCHGCS